MIKKSRPEFLGGTFQQLIKFFIKIICKFGFYSYLCSRFYESNPKSSLKRLKEVQASTENKIRIESVDFFEKKRQDELEL